MTLARPFVLLIFLRIFTTEEIIFSLDERVNKNYFLNRIWTSVGFSPSITNETKAADYLLSLDEQQNLAYVGAIPNSGITHVRIHWLLDLIKMNKSWISFSELDRFLQILHQNNLKPGFELMRHPTEDFFNMDTQINDKWSHLLTVFLQRYSEQYNLSTWRFETWNEPDLKMYNTFNMTTEIYRKYVKMTASILNKYHLKLWGPAGLFKQRKNHPLCWTALEECNKTCDFSKITFHKKGEESASEVVFGGVQLVQKLVNQFAHLKNYSFVNDEADPLSGWWRPKLWRSNVQYGAALIQIVIGYLEQSIIKKTINLSAISHDNAFLSYAPYETMQRTLLVRCNDTQGNAYFIKKPVYYSLVLLSLLGSKINQISYQKSNAYLRSKDKNRFSGIVAFGKDNLTELNTEQLTIKFSIPPGFVGFVYLMDNKKAIGCNKQPEILERTKIVDQAFFEETIKAPFVLAYNFCNKPQKFGTISNFHYLKISKMKVLFIWSDREIKTKCVASYKIEKKPLNIAKFSTLAEIADLTTIYEYNVNSTADLSGEYRVRLKDFWNRKGPYSDTISVRNV